MVRALPDTRARVPYAPGCRDMKWLKLVAVCLALSAAVLSAQQIPPGTTLPVMLNSTLDARRDKPSREIFARIMQNILLPDGARVPAGSRLVGHILQVSAPSNNSSSRLVFKFDQVVTHGRSIPITTSLRAMASMMDVYEAQMPTNALDDYGTTNSDWNTVQVGGDAAYRGNGQVF